MRGFRVWSDYWMKYATEAELYMDGSVDAIFEDDDGVPHHENADIVVELKTGLEDKNDKEICVGDIVASSYFGEDRILKVVFYEGCFCLCETRLDIPQAGAVYYFRQGSRFRPQDDYEVIGNIHENPELLEDEE